MQQHQRQRQRQKPTTTTTTNEHIVATTFHDQSWRVFLPFFDGLAVSCSKRLLSESPEVWDTMKKL